MIHNEDTLKQLRYLVKGKYQRERKQKNQVKRIFLGGCTRGRKQVPLKVFKQKMLSNKLIDQNEWDLRENFKEIVNGYPKFINKNMGSPDVFLKREKLLYKFFQMETGNRLVLP